MMACPGRATGGTVSTFWCRVNRPADALAWWLLSAAAGLLLLSDLLYVGECRRAGGRVPPGGAVQATAALWLLSWAGGAVRVGLRAGRLGRPAWVGAAAGGLAAAAVSLALPSPFFFPFLILAGLLGGAGAGIGRAAGSGEHPGPGRAGGR